MDERINEILGRADIPFELSITQYGKIRQYGLFTGSRKWKQHIHSKSDWDYVFLLSTLEQILPEVKAIDRFTRNRTLPDRYQDDPSVFFTLDMIFQERKVNIIIVSNEALLLAWRFATSVFCTHKEYVLRLFPTADSKKERHLYFQKLKLDFLHCLITSNNRGVS